MINYDSICNLSSGVMCNWCIQLDARQIITLTHQFITTFDNEVGVLSYEYALTYICR